MKHVKKLASILLALIMVLGLAITAFAAQTYSITIDNALEGETYTAYKIFDLTYSGTNNNPGITPTAPDPDNTSQHTAYSYTIGSSSEWWNVVTNNYSGTESTFTANDLKFTKTTTGNVWNVEAAAGFSAADFAKLLNENKANKTSAGSAVGTAAGTATINLTPDAAGYYFVDTTTGSLCSLDTTEPSATIREKNTIPSDTKEVKDSGEATETWGETDDAQIGDTVNFKLTVTDGKGTDRAIVLHDVMSDGLTLDISSFSVNGPSITADDYKIYVSSALTTTGTKPDSINHSINIAATDITDGAATNPKTLHAKDNDSFVIIFEADYVSELEENAEITVTYSAILNDNAVVGTAEKNVSHITYSNQTTQNKEVEVNTYDVDILKYAREDSNKKAIAGAVFQLQDKNGNALWLTKETDVAGFDVYEIALNQATDLTGLTAIEDENGNIIGYKDNNNDQVLYKQFTTTKDLKVRILGLDVDKSYLLEELKAPAGYNKLDQKIKAEASGTTLDFGDIEVANQAGAELPSTGGMGTTIFYVVGSILLIGAAVLLITRKRMNAKK